MAYSYKGSISFGLVYIPIALSLCVKNNDISFHLIDKETMSRIKYKKTCVDCDGNEVDEQNIVKGYEYQKGKFVILEDEDFEKIKSKRDKTITIKKFVHISQIDPVYFDKAYYVIPTGAEQAYRLLLGAMEEMGVAGIAKTVLGTKEKLIVLRIKDGQMLLNTLYYHDEIQPNQAKHIEAIKEGKELELAKTLIQGMSGDFVPEEFNDEYRQKLSELIEAKISGETVTVATEEVRRPKITSLMDALRLSIEEVEHDGKKVKKTGLAHERKASKSRAKQADVDDDEAEAQTRVKKGRKAPAAPPPKKEHKHTGAGA